MDRGAEREREREDVSVWGRRNGARRWLRRVKTHVVKARDVFVLRKKLGGRLLLEVALLFGGHGVRGVGCLERRRSVRPLARRARTRR
jgi:hypothetical protein